MRPSQKIWITIMYFSLGKSGGMIPSKAKTLVCQIFFSEIFSILVEVQNKVGGSSILIEVDNNQKLIDLYKEHGFQHLDTDQEDLSQLLILFDGI